MQVLYDDWMHSIELVPEWKGRWKPKFHLGDHLSEALAEHGPFRAYWCMWGEAFLQYLKRLFNMTNYRSAAYTVATLWAAVAKQRYRDPQRVTWHHDTVHPLSDPDFYKLADSTMSRAMALGVQKERPSTVRHLHSFERDGREITRSDWVMVSCYSGGTVTTVVGRISEMVQMNTCIEERVVSVVRLIIQHVVIPVFDEDDTVTVATHGGESMEMYVPVESSHVTCMCREVGEGMTMRLRLP